MYQIFNLIIRRLGIAGDVLDLLLISWIFFATFVVVSVWVYQKFFDRRKFLRGRQRAENDPTSTGYWNENTGPGLGEAESADWLALLGSWWLGFGATWQPALVTHWLQSITEEANKFLTSDKIQIEKARLNPDGKSLHISNISTDSSNTSCMILRFNLKLSDILLEIRTHDRPDSSETEDVQNKVLMAASLHASIKIVVSRLGSDKTNDAGVESSCVRLSLSYTSEPTIRLNFLPVSSLEIVDTEAVLQAVKEGIDRAGLVYDITSDGVLLKTRNSLNDTKNSDESEVAVGNGYMSNSVSDQFSLIDGEATYWEESRLSHDNRTNTNKNFSFATNSLAESNSQIFSKYTNGLNNVLPTIAVEKSEPEIPSQAVIREEIRGRGNTFDHVTDDSSSWDNSSDKRMSILSDRSEPVSISRHSGVGSSPLVEGYSNCQTSELNGYQHEYLLNGNDKDHGEPELNFSSADENSPSANLTLNSQLEMQNDDDTKIEKSTTVIKEEAPKKKGFFRRKFSTKSKKGERGASLERPKSENFSETKSEPQGGNGGTLKSSAGQYQDSVRSTPHDEQSSDTNNNDKTEEIPNEASNLRKARTNSLSSSVRNLFKKKKRNKSGQDGDDVSSVPSRDNSLSRRSGRDILRDSERTLNNYAEERFTDENNKTPSTLEVLQNEGVAMQNSFKSGTTDLKGIKNKEGKKTKKVKKGKN